jgi:hypothetical protein
MQLDSHAWKVLMDDLRTPVEPIADMQARAAEQRAARAAAAAAVEAAAAARAATPGPDEAAETSRDSGSDSDNDDSEEVTDIASDVAGSGDEGGGTKRTRRGERLSATGGRMHETINVQRSQEPDTPSGDEPTQHLLQCLISSRMMDRVSLVIFVICFVRAASMVA